MTYEEIMQLKKEMLDTERRLTKYENDCLQEIVKQKVEGNPSTLLEVDAACILIVDTCRNLQNLERTDGTGKEC